MEISINIQACPSPKSMLTIPATTYTEEPATQISCVETLTSADRYKATGLGLSLKAIGIDCLFLPRMQALLLRRPYFFQTLTQSIELAEHPPSLEKAAYLWTAKEAIAKALKTGVWQEGIDWKDLMLLDNGQIQLLNQAKIRLGEAQLTLQFQIKGDYAFAKASLWKEKSS